ncbi:MAG: tyrosine-protein phosphatase [Lentisphaeria bacterium]|nr:tyrosine-protein phosphatase [Lentisphaeria bacterium]
MSLHTAKQLKYIAMPREERRTKFVDESFRKDLASDGSWPSPVLLKWECDDGLQGEFIVRLSTTSDFAENSCTVYATKEKSLEITNLLIATTYYWNVQCGDNRSDVGVFVTADVAPRLLRVPNLWNCRDVGGRIGLNGRRVKQNMIIRNGGFVDNAEKIYYTIEELEKKPRFRERVDAMKAATQVLQNTLQKEVPFLLDGEWTVFRPDMKAFGEAEFDMVDALTEIPESFLGAKGVKMTVNEEGGIVLDKCNDMLPAVIMMDFVSPETGMMPFTCGADWYWYLRFNGVTIYDRRKGNGKMTAKNNYVLFLPVKQGRNLLTIYLGSGIASFSWLCAPVPQGTKLEEVFASGLEENATILPAFLKQGKRDENGNQLYTKGKVILTEEGASYFADHLGLKTEIDLRGAGECYGIDGSPAGKNVAWYNIHATAYDGIQNQPGRESLARAFRFFLDENYYPIDIHCIGGQDRTGTLAFVINALLGVPEEELYLDWECSAFWNKELDFRHEFSLDRLMNSFRKWPGSTINEEVENYVLSLGFTKEDIQHLRDILLEK